MAVAEEVVVDLIARTDRLERSLARAERETGSRLDRMTGMAQGFASRFTAALGGISALALARGLLSIADEAKNIDAQLRLATASAGSFAQATDDVRRIAENARAGLAATAELYGSFMRTSQELGKSQENAATATETFSKALKIGGAGTAQVASATLQMGQALASSNVQWEELGQILEASPRLAKVFTDALGVTRQQLKQMAADGALSGEMLFEALNKPGIVDQINKEFSTLPVTFDQAMGQISNAAVITFGAFDRGGEFSTMLANFFSDGADGFGQMETDAEEAGISIRSTFESLVGVFFPMQDHALNVFDVIKGEAIGLRNLIADILGAADSARNAFNRAAQGARAGAIEGATNLLTGGPAGNLNPGYKGWVRDKLGSIVPQATPVGPKMDWKDQFLQNATKQDAARRTATTARSFREQGIFGGGFVPVDPDEPAARRASGASGKKKKKGPRGPSAETLAKRAESARVAEERREQAFQNEESGLKRDLLAARSALVNSAEIRAQFERQEIEADRVEYADKLASQVSTKKLTEAEAERLRVINDQVAVERTNLVNLEEAARQRKLAEDASAQAVDAAVAESRDQQDLLQSRAGLAETTAERRDIELRLVDLQFEEERIRLRAIIAESERLNAIENATESEKDAARSAAAAAEIARKRLGVLPELQGNAQEGVKRGNEGALARYRRELGQPLNEQLENLGVDQIRGLEDAFGDTTKKVLGLKGAVGDLIAELAKLALKQAIMAGLNALGVSTGATPGGLPGFANGGSFLVGGNGGTDRNVLSINGVPRARVSGSERINVVPQGKAVGPMAGSVTPQSRGIMLNQTFHFDNRGSVNPQGYAEHIKSQVRQETGAIVGQAMKQTSAGVPARMASYQKLQG